MNAFKQIANHKNATLYTIIYAFLKIIHRVFPIFYIFPIFAIFPIFPIFSIFPIISIVCKFRKFSPNTRYSSIITAQILIKLFQTLNMHLKTDNYALI